MRRRDGTILILGAGLMQLPAIRAARRLGLRTVVADGNPNALGKAEADSFAHVDLNDLEGMLALGARLKERGDLAGVFTAGTDFSSTVAYVAENLGLPGIPYQVALNATDKFRMRSVLREAGVPVPSFTVCGEADLEPRRFAAVTEAVGYPVVVKPVDSMGARGVVRADTPDQALEFAHEAITHSRTSRVVVEGFIPGSEFSLDALVFGGEVLVTGFADRHIRFPPHFVEMGHTIPSNLPDEAREGIVKVFIRAVKALGITHGAAKGDMKLSPDGPVVGEIAARLSGGFMSGWTFPLSSGISLTELGIRIAIGEPPGSVAPNWRRVAAERAVISIPGVIAEIRGVEVTLKAAQIAEVFVMRQPGDVVRFPRNNVEKAANVIAAADTRESACRAAESGVSGIEVVLRHPAEETENFLFATNDGHWAYAGEAGWAEILPGEILDVAAMQVLLSHALGGRTSRPLQIAPNEVQDRSAGRVDWSYRTVDESVGRLVREGRIELRAGADRAASTLFWRALLRGGLPGARYLVDLLTG